MATGVNHSERRRLVITKAMALFARMGYAKVSFLMISEATGIARTALYRYFKTKRDIFDEAIHEITSGIGQELERIRQRGDQPVTQRIVQACNVVIDALYGKREFFSAICSSIADRARAYNLNLIWGARQEFNELARDGSLDDYIARCKASNIKGVFFVPQDAMGERGVELRNQQIAETLRRKGITVVLIDRDIVPFPRRSDFDFVGIDNVQAGYEQAKHLIACGCRRLVYVSHEKQVWTVDLSSPGNGRF